MKRESRREIVQFVGLEEEQKVEVLTEDGIHRIPCGDNAVRKVVMNQVEARKLGVEYENFVLGYCQYEDRGCKGINYYRIFADSPIEDPNGKRPGELIHNESVDYVSNGFGRHTRKIYCSDCGLSLEEKEEECNFGAYSFCIDCGYEKPENKDDVFIGPPAP